MDAGLFLGQANSPAAGAGAHVEAGPTTKRGNKVVQAVDPLNPAVSRLGGIIIVAPVVERAQHGEILQRGGATNATTLCDLEMVEILQRGGATAYPGFTVVHLALIRPHAHPSTAHTGVFAR